jgi:hypothetical protein
MDLLRRLKCFLGFLGQKWVENKFLGKKLTSLDFLTTTVIGIWKKLNDPLLNLFKKKQNRVDDPTCHKKKGPGTRGLTK